MERLYTLEEAQNLFAERKRRARKRFLERLKFLAIQKLMGATLLIVVIGYVKITGDLTPALFGLLAMYLLLVNKRVI